MVHLADQLRRREFTGVGPVAEAASRARFPHPSPVVFLQNDFRLGMVAEGFCQQVEKVFAGHPHPSRLASLANGGGGRFPARNMPNSGRLHCFRNLRARLPLLGNCRRNDLARVTSRLIWVP